jgi:hypothetical protein
MNSATPGSKSARAGRNALLPYCLPGPMSDRFIRHAAAMERPLDYVIGYCELLAAAGVEPLYRESEPLF